MINKKEKIIRALTKNKTLSTTKIAYTINSNHWATEKFLNELEKEGRIKKIKETTATYWELVR